MGLLCRWNTRKRRADWVVLCAAMGMGLAAGLASEANSTRPAFPGGVIAYPESFHRIVEARKLTDTMQKRFQIAENGLGATSYRPTPAAEPLTEFFRVVRPVLPDAVREYRRPMHTPVIAMRGYRAPILGAWTEPWPINFDPEATHPNVPRAAAIIVRGLQTEGFMITLARVIEALGPELFLQNPEQGLHEAQEAGFPTDLIQYFGLGNTDPRRQSPIPVVQLVARQLINGVAIAEARGELRTRPFRFVRTHPNFLLETESGEQEIGLLRMQIGGGYRNGILPGGNLDVAGQLIAALPDVEFLMSTSEEFAETLEWIAGRCWKLNRPSHLTLVHEPITVSSWAQDSGKAGYLRWGDTVSAVATMVPRYASRGEDVSMFVPGESFLADGLRTAGHEVVHSPLLFQGGNLLPVEEPGTRRRVLLLSEGDLYRNMALGLSSNQVVEALRLEFAMDECQVIPAVSYHLDQDISVRAQAGRLLVFVNDTPAAVRLILEQGIGAMERAQAFTPAVADSARAHLKAGQDLPLVQLLGAAISQQITAQDRFPRSFTRAFAVTNAESAADNLRTFLLAVDFLASHVFPPERFAANGQLASYMQWLRQLPVASEAQVASLRKRGWVVVPVPSMPDMHYSINYLNGIHDRTRFLMPAYGGFYAPVDQAVLQVFQRELGPGVKIIPINSSESQRMNGAVHCQTAAYRRLSKS